MEKASFPKGSDSDSVGSYLQNTRLSMNSVVGILTGKDTRCGVRFRGPLRLPLSGSTGDSHTTCDVR